MALITQGDFFFFSTDQFTEFFISGTRPARRCWERWPLSFLEPEGMNKEEEIQKNVSKGDEYFCDVVKTCTG